MFPFNVRNNLREATREAERLRAECMQLRREAAKEEQEAARESASRTDSVASTLRVAFEASIGSGPRFKRRKLCRNR